MSTDTEFRFPTIPAAPGDQYGRHLRIPVMPRSSVFETVKEDLNMPEIEEVMARPKWDFEEANLRLFKEAKARKAAEKAPRKPKAAAKSTPPKGKPTPKRNR